jgi:hypothetical protein
MAVPGVNPVPTSALGIAPSDLIIKKAIDASLEELRANQWLLDYVFAGLNFDDLTSTTYGQKDINEFKKWFLATDIESYINVRLGDITMPAVTINLVNSVEEENTLSDLGPDPVQEDVPVSASGPGLWPALTNPFTPQYTVTTGQLLLPASVSIQLFPGMVIVDGSGLVWPIQDVLDDQTVQLQTGIVTNFAGSTVRSATPAMVQTIESAMFRETYLIGCHVSGEPAHLVYLHGVILFVLLRGRQFFLEGRGLERTALTSTDFARNQDLGEAENAYSRYINMSGYVRHSWPKFRYQKIAGVSIQIIMDGMVNLPKDAQPSRDQLWIGTGDPLNTTPGNGATVQINPNGDTLGGAS